jgi:arylsulfatase
MCLIAWPQGIKARGEVRHQYVHAVDIVPTLYELLGITPPDVLKGYTQSPIEGESFKPTFEDPDAPGRENQFYAMLGQRAIYHKGWLANTVHPPLSGWSNFGHDVWELYNLQEDRAQMHNLADQNRDMLDLLKGLWFYYAGVYNGMPLDDRSALEIISTPRPQPSRPRSRYIYYPGTAEVPESVAVNIRGRSYTIAAGVTIDSPDAQGVLFAHGGVGGGHSLYIADGRLHYVYNWLGDAIQKISSRGIVPTGRHVFTAEFARDGEDTETKSALGTLTLYMDMKPMGQGRIKTQPGFFSLTGDGFCVGRDGGSPVSPDYAAPFHFTGGTIDRVVIDVSGEPFIDFEKQVTAWIMRD